MTLAASDGVWDAHVLGLLDVSADVIEAAVDCDTSGARARLELDNSGGQYSAYGSGALRRCSEAPGWSFLPATSPAPATRSTARASTPTGSSRSSW